MLIPETSLTLAFAGVKNSSHNEVTYSRIVAVEDDPLEINTLELWAIYAEWAEDKWTHCSEFLQYQRSHQGLQQSAPAWLQVEPTGGLYKPYSVSSISKRLKDLWSDKSIQALIPSHCRNRPYDIRSHCSSSAFLLGVDLKRVTAHANWKSESTFKQSYLRNVKLSGALPPPTVSISAALRWEEATVSMT